MDVSGASLSLGRALLPFPRALWNAVDQKTHRYFTHVSETRCCRWNSAAEPRGAEVVSRASEGS